MGAMKELLMDMEDDVLSSDKDAWISKWGSHNLDVWDRICLLYTSPSPRDGLLSRMPSSA